MSGDISREQVVDAFDAAVTYWHNQIDEPIPAHDDGRPSTAREYFEDIRGFDSETVDDWRLGWAPADGGLFEHLQTEGFDEETIAATGLFCESNPEKELWFGRYIMPYFSADGRAEYAIARCTGSKGGGAAGYDGHPEDFLAGKYAKIAHTRENVPLTEPILGLHTLDGANEVVVAEGIADAITAHEAGYAALSPVTKEFKREHFEQLVDAIEEHGIERVYVVPDAEIASYSEIDSEDVPDEPEHAYEAINIPTVAPGPGGGLRTANYLVEQGIDARLVELPRPSALKVDLDDYLQTWSDDLYAVKASSKPPTEHPQYEAATATQSTDEPEEQHPDARDRDERTPSTSGGRSSATGLFELDVGDVNPDLEAGHRGKNPLGHVGSTENYFVVNEHPVSGDLIGKDYKRPGTPRYTGCTYLLVEIGERSVDAPMGELSARETWEAWSEARERGLLGPGDVIPTKALEHIARREQLYDMSALDDDADLPPKAHNRALWWVNERWPERDGVDVQTDEDGDTTARSGRARDSVPARTWEDVRYIYENSKEAGRSTARHLLSEKYNFMTLANSNDELLLYDEDTGTYTDRTAPVRGEIYDGLGEHWSTHELNEILAGLRQHNVVQQQDLNAAGLDGPHICVENGVLNLFTRELKEHSPEYYFVDRVPVRYDPDADTEPYDEFLSDLVARDADRQAMVEMVGHALMPDANERYKKFMILVGDADNGKTAFFSRVTSLLNGPEGEEKNTSAVKLEKLTQNRFSAYSMYGHMANVAGEIDGKRIQNTGSIKDITGGDTVELEPKGKESFHDTMNTTLMFAANDPPIIGKRDKEAIRKRIVPVKLPYTFTDNPTDPMEKQKRPEREIEKELDDPAALSGFLNLALDGIERLEENNGDVSLPESYEERLRKYERTADPMREFGERCLENSADSYLVKADVTTMYREFATANGYEVGDNLGRVLHNVLRGVPDLNYTDSRPEKPDYSDTELPLRGWDERKWVVDRVALTDEGMKYAEAAGLVEEDTDEDTAEQTGPTPLSNIETGYGRSFTATVAAVSDGEYSREAQGSLKGPHGTYIGFVIPGGNHNALDGKQGATLRFEDVTVRTDDDGLKEAVINDAATVTEIDDSQQRGLDDGAKAQAATDGGDRADEEPEQEQTGDEDTEEPTLDGLKPAVEMYVRDATDGRTREQIVEHLKEAENATDEIAAEAIDAVADDRKITKASDEKYRT